MNPAIVERMKSQRSNERLFQAHIELAKAMQRRNRGFPRETLLRRLWRWLKGMFGKLVR